MKISLSISKLYVFETYSIWFSEEFQKHLWLWIMHLILYICQSNLLMCNNFEIFSCLTLRRRLTIATSMPWSTCKRWSPANVETANFFTPMGKRRSRPSSRWSIRGWKKRTPINHRHPQMKWSYIVSVKSNNSISNNSNECCNDSNIIQRQTTAASHWFNCRAGNYCSNQYLCWLLQKCISRYQPCFMTVANFTSFWWHYSIYGFIVLNTLSIPISKIKNIIAKRLIKY